MTPAAILRRRATALDEYANDEEITYRDQGHTYRPDDRGHCTTCAYLYDLRAAAQELREFADTIDHQE